MAEYGKLKAFSAEIEDRFLSAHLGLSQLGPPSQAESLDVAAFVVLLHGAIENFAEGLALWILAGIEQSWVVRKRSSRSAMSLMLYSDAPDENTLHATTVFDNVRGAIAKSKSAMSVRIRNNNGISAKDLRAMLRPLGVDVPNDAILLGSLDQIVAIRHRWAHQYRFGASVAKSASDVKQYADDCLKLTQRLARATAALGL